MTIFALRWISGSFVKKESFRFFRNLQHVRRHNGQISGLDNPFWFCNAKLTVQTSYASYSDLSGLSWKRPEGPPRIWQTFEGRKRSDDAENLRFTIQDLPEDRVEDVIEFVIRYVLSEEKFAATLGIAKDPLAIEEFRSYWTKAALQGISIVTLAQNADDPASKPAIAGANILTVVTDLDESKSRNPDQFKSKSVKKFWNTLFDLESQLDVLTKYGVDKYLGSIGLLVHPRFRGHGLGEKMLKVRDDIGRAYGIVVTKASFTSKWSQASARRAGFELQLEKKSSEILDDEGNLLFPDLTREYVHVMTKRLR